VQTPRERPAALGKLEARGVGVQPRTPARQATGNIDHERGR